MLQHCPDLPWKLHGEGLSIPDFWELTQLEQGFAQRQLSPIQAKMVIRSATQECFFDLCCQEVLRREWEPVITPLASQVSSQFQSAALSVRDVQTLYHKATSMQQEWQSAGFRKLSPNLAPVLTQSVDPMTLSVHQKYLTGQFNLWDISLWMGRSLTWLAQALLPLVKSNCLRFSLMPDLPVANEVIDRVSKSAIPTNMATTKQQGVTISPSALEPEVAPPAKALIACIDDSPVLAHRLKKILEPAGYQVMSIQEPMRGFAALIENKPDFIFLDLNLPNADGYSICKFLRDTPVFEKTPIVILTGQNTQVDRMKARMVGATEFLAKPPQPQALLAILKSSITATMSRH
ncbi:MAG: response regulator [Cyanobacteria bacterium J06635_1]